MVRFDQPEQFHGSSETSLDNYPVLQVEFTMLDKINSVYDPRDDHRLLISSNDIREDTTLGAMFHTQSVYMPTGGHKEPYKVMKCMTFDPPTPVESGIEHQMKLLINATDAMMIGVSIHNKDMVRNPCP